MKIWMVLLGALYVGQYSFAGGAYFGWQDEERDSSEGIWTQFGLYESGETLGVDQGFQDSRSFKLDLNDPQEKLVFDMCEGVLPSGPSSEKKTTIKQEKKRSKRGGRKHRSRQENLKHHQPFKNKENIGALSKPFVPKVSSPEFIYPPVSAAAPSTAYYHAPMATASGPYVHHPAPPMTFYSPAPARQYFQPQSMQPTQFIEPLTARQGFVCACSDCQRNQVYMQLPRNSGRPLLSSVQPVQTVYYVCAPVVYSQPVYF